MNNILDSPKGEFSQPNLPEASNVEKKEYVRKIVTHIVDGYVIRRENVENIFNSLHSMKNQIYVSVMTA